MHPIRPSSFNPYHLADHGASAAGRRASRAITARSASSIPARGKHGERQVTSTNPGPRSDPMAGVSDRRRRPGSVSTVDYPGHLAAVVFCQGCPGGAARIATTVRRPPRQSRANPGRKSRLGSNTGAGCSTPWCSAAASPAAASGSGRCHAAGARARLRHRFAYCGHVSRAFCRSPAARGLGRLRREGAVRPLSARDGRQGR